MIHDWIICLSRFAVTKKTKVRHCRHPRSARPKGRWFSHQGTKKTTKLAPQTPAGIEMGDGNGSTCHRCWGIPLETGKSQYYALRQGDEGAIHFNALPKWDKNHLTDKYNCGQEALTQWTRAIFHMRPYISHGNCHFCFPSIPKLIGWPEPTKQSRNLPSGNLT